jgi:hypothetical protein
MIWNGNRNLKKRLDDGNGDNSRQFYLYKKERSKSKPGIGPLKKSKMRNCGGGPGNGGVIE